MFVVLDGWQPTGSQLIVELRVGQLTGSRLIVELRVGQLTAATPATPQKNIAKRVALRIQHDVQSDSYFFLFPTSFFSRGTTQRRSRVVAHETY
jgi:hypothetical protein